METTKMFRIMSLACMPRVNMQGHDLEKTGTVSHRKSVVV